MEHILRQRIAKTRRDVMEPLGLDMLLAYADDMNSVGAVRYLTDFDLYALYALVAVPARGDVALTFGFHHSAYVVRVREVAVADYFLGTLAPGELCRRLLDDMDAGTTPRIGVVGGQVMFSRIFRDFLQHVSNAELVAVDTEFWRSATEVGTDNGVAFLRRSGLISRRCAGTATRRLSASATPAEIRADVTHTAHRLGSDIIDRDLVYVRLGLGLPLPARLRPANGTESSIVDAMAVEVSASYRGQRSLCGRTLLAETAAAKNLRQPLHDAEAVHAQICAGFYPGATVKDIVDAAGKLNPMVQRGGNEGIELGHGIGFSYRQEPILRAGSDAVLRSGMAIALRTSWDAGAAGTIHLADTVLVTPQGAELITV